jgi:hypothetical protein
MGAANLRRQGQPLDPPGTALPLKGLEGVRTLQPPPTPDGTASTRP